ncbi:MAG: hypothetical protein KW804_02660 [Candidatus Doudnabacteria bacterium]|nr:hypothetical protein [Candidatus Doudnabacteria bacterium]
MKYLKSNKINNAEAGVTLLLAILIMSGLTLIATTLAFLGVNQIRASRAVLVTEPALLAAQIGGEEGLWKAKRSDDLSSLVDCPTGTSQSISASSSYNTYCKSFGSGTFNVTSGSAETVVIYDPNDPDGNTSLLGMSPSYSSIIFTHKSGVQVNATVERLDGSGVGLSPGSCIVNASSSLTCSINISPMSTSTDEGRILVTLTSAAPAVIEVTTNRGMPTNLNIVSNACSTRQATLTSCSPTNTELYNRKVEVKFK